MESTTRSKRSAQSSRVWVLSPSKTAAGRPRLRKAGRGDVSARELFALVSQLTLKDLQQPVLLEDLAASKAVL